MTCQNPWNCRINTRRQKHPADLSANSSMAQGSVRSERAAGPPHGLQSCDCPQHLCPSMAPLEQPLLELAHPGCSLHHSSCPDPGLQACPPLPCRLHPPQLASPTGGHPNMTAHAVQPMPLGMPQHPRQRQHPIYQQARKDRSFICGML